MVAVETVILGRQHFRKAVQHHSNAATLAAEPPSWTGRAMAACLPTASSRDPQELEYLVLTSQCHAISIQLLSASTTRKQQPRTQHGPSRQTSGCSWASAATRPRCLHYLKIPSSFRCSRPDSLLQTLHRLMWLILVSIHHCLSMPCTV